MRVFCEYIRRSVSNHFGIEINASVSRKKRLVHFAFKQPLLSYPFYDELSHFLRKEWKVCEIFFEDSSKTCLISSIGGDMIMFFFRRGRRLKCPRGKASLKTYVIK